MTDHIYNRAAIVIGNGAYVEGRLANPTSDAVAIDKKLNLLGFETLCRMNLSRQEIFDTISEFHDKYQKCNVSLLFYAGHGLQADGKNYLLPVDTKLRRSMDLNRYGIELGVLVDSLKEVSSSALLFLDCCRNNPFAERIAFGGQSTTRDIKIHTGLAHMPVPTGTFFAFATQPNNIAEDGAGKHSPFTEALLNHISSPNQSISDMMIDVSNDVLSATNSQQHPFSQSSLLEKFIFNEKKRVDGASEPRSRDEEEWIAIIASNSISVFEQFIEAHPQSQFRKYAEAKIVDIRSSSNVAQTMSDLQRPGMGPLSWIPVQRRHIAEEPEQLQPEHRSRKKLGLGNMLDPTILEGLISISVFSVAKISTGDGRAIGTAFVVKGEDVDVSLGEELLIFTANHVVNGVSRSNFAFPVEEISIFFEGMASRGLPAEPLSVRKIVAESPDADFTLLALDENIDSFARPIPIAKGLPEFDPETPLTRETRPPVISISYPYGGGVQFGSIDNYLLDYDRSAVTESGGPTDRPVMMHYTAASEPGSSGCPILSDQLEVLAVHQGGADQLGRLNGIEGTYSANFGHWIQSVIVTVREQSEAAA